MHLLIIHYCTLSFHVFAESLLYSLVSCKRFTVAVFILGLQCTSQCTLVAFLFNATGDSHFVAALYSLVSCKCFTVAVFILGLQCTSQCMLGAFNTTGDSLFSGKL